MVFKLIEFNFARGRTKPAPEPQAAPAERRTAPRQLMFQEAVLQIEDYYNIRAVITDLSETGARVHFATRRDLPFRIRISAPTLKLKCWARVVWQEDGKAGLEFLPNE